MSTDDARVKGTLITVSCQVPWRLLTMAMQEGQRLNTSDRIAQVQQVARVESKRVQLLLDTVNTQQRKVRESEALKTLAIA